MITRHALVEQMRRNARENGYFICPDPQLFNDLIDGLLTNATRYGYGSCPCRIASGVKTYDADIICPCEYRDADVDEHGTCYCGLFVSEKMKNDPAQMRPIPERRPAEIIDAAFSALETAQVSAQSPPKPPKQQSSLKVWRCSVCGYLCARELPPAVCPICKAKAERFEQFPFGEKY